jgi:hypothetical protein
MSKEDQSNSHKWQPTRQNLHSIEENAALLRQRAGLASTDKLNAIKLSKKFNIEIVYPYQITSLSPEQSAYLSVLDAKVWSGISNELPNGKLLIILNPNQTDERANVTVMEEIAHVHYGHEPSQLNGFGERKYDENAEQEAYQTAAAALLPSEVVARAIWNGETTKVLAERYGASVELVEMRIKILNLWGLYQENIKNRR